MTGLTFMAAELNAKRLEILRDVIPDLRRVAVIANPEHPGSEVERTYSEETARKLGLTLEFFGTATKGQLTSAFAAMDSNPRKQSRSLLTALPFSIVSRLSTSE